MICCRYSRNALPPHVVQCILHTSCTYSFKAWFMCSCLCPLWWNNYNFYQVLDMSIDINIDKRTGNYFPTIYFNEFWLMKDKLVAVNETVTELILNLELGPIGLTKWQIFLQIDQSFQIHRSYGSMVEGEADELKVRFWQGDFTFLYLCRHWTDFTCSLTREFSWRGTHTY